MPKPPTSVGPAWQRYCNLSQASGAKVRQGRALNRPRGGRFLGWGMVFLGVRGWRGRGWYAGFRGAGRGGPGGGRAGRAQARARRQLVLADLGAAAGARAQAAGAAFLAGVGRASQTAGTADGAANFT